MSYRPNPIATGGILLPESLRVLSERLAENTHEVWAAARLAEGWSHGPRRDDEAKTHPCLVPYAELSEIEKDYDRRTSAETLKAILTLGYTIGEPGSDPRGGRP